MRPPEKESGNSRRVLRVVVITVAVLLVAAVFTAIGARYPKGRPMRVVM